MLRLIPPIVTFLAKHCGVHLRKDTQYWSDAR